MIRLLPAFFFTNIVQFLFHCIYSLELQMISEFYHAVRFGSNIFGQWPTQRTKLVPSRTRQQKNNISHIKWYIMIYFDLHPQLIFQDIFSVQATFEKKLKKTSCLQIFTPYFLQVLAASHPANWMASRGSVVGAICFFNVLEICKPWI